MLVFVNSLIVKESYYIVWYLALHYQDKVMRTWINIRLSIIMKDENWISISNGIILIMDL